MQSLFLSGAFLLLLHFSFTYTLLLLEQQVSYQQKAPLNTSATSDCCGLSLGLLVRVIFIP